MITKDKSFTARLLGGFSLVYEGKPLLDLGGERPQLLIAYLLLHKDRPLTRQEIAFLFWPDVNESQARTNFRNLLHRIRRLLPELDQFIGMDGNQISWHSDEPIHLDVELFEHGIARAEAAFQNGRPLEALENFKQAIESYDGDLLPGCYEDWVFPFRERLRESLFRALESLTGLFEARREYEHAIPFAQRWVRDDPLSEAAYLRLIQLHALKGDRSNALRSYHACVTILQRELGVDPSSEIQAIYRRLMQLEESVSLSPQKNVLAPMVGRTSDWELLLSTWRTLSDGNYPPQCVMIAGMSGIGKTRLAEEFIDWVQRQGFTALSARSYSAEGELAYAPLGTWLKGLSLENLPEAWKIEIARLSPELLAGRFGESGPGPLTETWQRQRFHEALAHAILDRSQPILLFLDDIQWTDQQTLEWLHFLMRFDVQARVLLLATSRIEDVSPDGKLNELINALRQRGQFIEIPLDRLTISETTELASKLSGSQLSADIVKTLYHRTEGIPLFIVEMSRAGWEHLGSSSTSLPDRLLATLEQRISDLSIPARNAVEVASVIGRAFTAPLLAASAELDEPNLLACLDELWKRHILLEHGRDSYDFSHDKFRQIVHDMLSPARRQSIHRHVAESLTQLEPDDLWGLAQHLEHGGLTNQAAQACFLAAKQDMEQAAYLNAQRGFAHALLLLDDQAIERRTEILIALAKVCDILGEQAQASEAITGALQLTAGGEENLLRLQALALAGDFAAKTGRIDEGRKWFEMAVDVAHHLNDISQEISVLLQSADMEIRAGKAQLVRDLYERSLELARQIKAHSLEADALEGLGFILPAVGDSLALARQYIYESAQIRRMLGNRLGEARSLCNLMGLLHACGAYEEAINLAPEALQKNQAVNYRRGAAIVESGHGLAAYELGLYDEARALLQHARSEYAAIGEEDGYGLHTGSLGMVAMAQGNDVEAEALFAEGLKIAETNQTDIFAAMHHLELGHLHVSQTHWEVAREHLQKGLAVNIENGDNLGILFCKTLLSRISRATGDLQEASHLAEQSLQGFRESSFEEAGALRWLWQLHVLLQELGWTEQAEEVLHKAQEQLELAASHIHSPDLRRSFLENVSHHRLIWGISHTPKRKKKN